jgi:hypothetical protein
MVTVYVPRPPVPVPKPITIVFRGIFVPESIIPIVMIPVLTAVTVIVLVNMFAAVAILPVNMAIIIPFTRTLALLLLIQDVPMLGTFPVELMLYELATVELFPVVYRVALPDVVIDILA